MQANIEVSNYFYQLYLMCIRVDDPTGILNDFTEN